MAAGIKYTSTRGGGLNGNSFREMAAEMQDIFWEELTQAAQEGEAEAKAFIGIAGTQHTWTGAFKGRTGPNRGRIDTGAMQRAVSYRVHRGGQNVQLDVGWIHPGEYEDYFAAQDEGFSAGGFRPSQTVEGMHMLAHLRYYMRDRVDLAMDRAVGRIFDGI